MIKNSKHSLYMVTYSAVIAFSAFISFPASSGSLPFVIQNCVALGAGLLLGFPQGAASVGIFLTMGVLGLPVFPGHSGSIGIISSSVGSMTAITGPSGGFLAGYFFAALFAGFVAGKPKQEEKNFSKNSILKLLLAALIGLVFMYIPGILFFRKITGSSFNQALEQCFFPYIFWDLGKIVLCVPIFAFLRKKIAPYL